MAQDPVKLPAVKKPDPPQAVPAEIIVPPRQLLTGAPQLPESAETVSLEMPKNIEPDRDNFWAILLPDCPLDVIVAGGVSFSKRSKATSLNDEGRAQAVVPRDGQTVRLNPLELESVKQSLLGKGIQITWKKHAVPGQGEQLSPVAQLVPLRSGVLAAAWFTALVKVGEGFQPHANSYQKPQAMARRPDNLDKLLSPPSLRLLEPQAINSVTAVVMEK